MILVPMTPKSWVLPPTSTDAGGISSLSSCWRNSTGLDLFKGRSSNGVHVQFMFVDGGSTYACSTRVACSSQSVFPLPPNNSSFRPRLRHLVLSIC